MGKNKASKSSPHFHLLFSYMPCVNLTQFNCFRNPALAGACPSVPAMAVCALRLFSVGMGLQ